MFAPASKLLQRTLIFTLLALPCARLSIAQSSAPTLAQSAIPNTVQPITAAPATPPADNSAVNIPIGAGDLLDVKVYGVPDLSDTVRVSSSGEIAMPLIGAVSISGMTAEAAQKTIEARLLRGGFLKDPHVSVFVKEYTSQGIAVLGEVQHPGYFPYIHARRLLDAISASGGFTPLAGKTIVITHSDASKPETIAWSYDADSVQSSNVDLRPGDTVAVNKAGVIYVTGSVKKPGGFVMSNSDSLTVLQALALAEGPTPTASLNKARLIRKTPAGPKDIDVQLKDINNSKKPDLAMQANDILFVPNSAGKSAGRRSLESIVNVATGVAIYRP